MLPFDALERHEDGLHMTWCEGPPQGHPFTGEWLQVLPVDIPRYFEFFVIKERFGPDDISKLLAAWGEENSPWDLNLDGFVDGVDLAIALGGWDEGNEGSP